MQDRRGHTDWSSIPVGAIQNGLELEAETEPALSSSHDGMNYDDDISSVNARNLQSFRANLFGDSSNPNDDEECVDFLPSGSSIDNGTRRSSTGSTGEHTHGGSGPSWTRTTKGRVEQDYFGQQEENAGAYSRDFPQPPMSPNSPASPWTSPLNLSLFAANLLSSVAETIPVVLVPTIGKVLSGGNNDGDAGGTASSFASRAAASAVLGTSLGKFVNGPAGDIFGARRVVCLYSLLLGVALLGLSLCSAEETAIVVLAIIEFVSSVQQPCIVIILAAHYRDEDGSGENVGVDQDETNSAEDVNISTSRLWDDVEQHGDSTLRKPKEEGKYEAGIYIASLGSRFGSLLAIPFTAILLHIGFTWRAVARIASMLALACFMCFYLFVSDAPGKLHFPSNPIRQSTLIAAQSRHRNDNGLVMGRFILRSSLVGRLYRWAIIAWSVFVVNVVPSLRLVLTSGTFWIVASAHAGGSMVRSSERILGQYIRDTSSGSISEEKAGGFTIFLSLGIFIGLAVGGESFTQTAQQPRKRKQMVIRLYALAVAMCYTLSFLAAPAIRTVLWSPKIVMLFQIVAAFFMGSGIAVQYYQIPAIVGATFGSQKGLYSAYTDGVANFVSSLIWRVVGGAVEEGQPEMGGWAYGWAAVALLVVLCSVLMVQFVEHYFCRDGWKARMEKAASDSAMQRKNKDGQFLQSQTEGNVFGDRGNFLRRRFGVGSSSPRSIGIPNSFNGGGMGFSMPPSPKRSLQAFTKVNVSQISRSPMKFIQNLGSLRSKSALGDADDDDDEEEIDEGVAGIDQNGNESDEDSTILFDSIAGPVIFDDDSIYGANADNSGKNGRQLTPQQQRKEKLLQLLALKENQVCADCPIMMPRWASMVVGLSRVEGKPLKPLGCFVCHDCVPFHRQLGTHVVYVRSVDHDAFQQRDIDALESGGNNKVNVLLEAILHQDDTAVKPGTHASHRIRAQFIRQKYDVRKWSLDGMMIRGSQQQHQSFPVDDLLGLQSPIIQESAVNRPNNGELLSSSPDAIELSHLSVDEECGGDDESSSDESEMMIMSL